MRVGDRIDVFKMLSHGTYGNYNMQPGSHRTGHKDVYDGYLITSNFKTPLFMCDNEVKKVGTLIIKTIK